MTEITYNIKCIYGHVVLGSYIDGAGMGMGRKRTYDRQGKLISDVTKPTGLRLIWQK
jgi:hypothetical protein